VSGIRSSVTIGVGEVSSEFTVGVGGVQLTAALLIPKALRYLRPMGAQTAPPKVWIEEQHRDQLAITEHPVEQGTTISDHAFRRPAECTIRVGWAGESYAELTSIYEGIMRLVVERVLFDLQTGKRKYINMLAQQVAVTTDERSETVLLAVITCREVLLASTSTTMVPANPNSAVEPEKTAATTNSGNTKTTPSTGYNPSGTPPSVVQGQTQEVVF
jgi:hypothetical protein